MEKCLQTSAADHASEDGASRQKVTCQSVFDLGNDCKTIIQPADEEPY